MHFAFYMYILHIHVTHTSYTYILNNIHICIFMFVIFFRFNLDPYYPYFGPEENGVEADKTTTATTAVHVVAPENQVEGEAQAHEQVPPGILLLWEMLREDSSSGGENDNVQHFSQKNV